MNRVTQLRRAHLDRFIDVSAAQGLEVGPYNQPMVSRSEGDIKYLDYMTRAQLLDLKGPEHLQGDIPETDYIVSDNHYNCHVKEDFDYIIANHVAEHSPNFVRFFRDLADLIRPQGILFIALPDKKFTFDKFRSDTDLSHILYDFYKDVDEISMEHLLELELYYDLNFTGQEMRLSGRLNNERLKQVLSQKPHIGIHCHVFRSETLLSKVMYPLMYMGLIPFKLLKFVPAKAEHGGEMIAVLQKGIEDTLPFSASDFFVAPEVASSTDAVLEKAPNSESPVKHYFLKWSGRIRG
jgi:hypothetical protein